MNRSLLKLSALSGIAMAISAIGRQNGDQFLNTFGANQVEPDGTGVAGGSVEGAAEAGAVEGAAEAGAGSMKIRGNNCSYGKVYTIIPSRIPK